MSSVKIGKDISDVYPGSKTHSWRTPVRIGKEVEQVLPQTTLKLVQKDKNGDIERI